MNKQTLKSIYTIFLLISWILFLLIDFFYSMEFNIEGKYFFILVPTIVVALIQLFVEFKQWLTHLLFYLIFGIVLIQFYYVLIAAWGFLFLGGHFPISWFVAMILNCLLAINRLEIYYRFNKKRSIRNTSSNK
jgi:hypothetical protein